MIEYLLRGLTLGATASLMPGPLQTYSINSAIAFGLRRSLIIVLSPLLADLPVMIVVLFIVRQFPPAFLSLLQVGGGLFLLYLAYSGSRAFAKGAAIRATGDTELIPPAQLLGRGVVLNMLSPGPYLFWSTVHAPNVFLAAESSIWYGIGYVVAFYAMFFAGMAEIMFIFNRLGQISEEASRWIVLGTIIALTLFGLSLLYQGIMATAVAVST